MKNKIKISLTVLAFGVSALAVKANFAAVPNAANGTSLTDVLSHMTITGDNDLQASARDQRQYSGSAEAAGSPRINAAIVPEPTTILAGALLLLPLAMGAVRSLRRGKSDPAIA